MDAALASGADLVVHLDGDGQHDPAYIPRLVARSCRARADVVVGVRPLAEATDILPCVDAATRSAPGYSPDS